MLGKGEPLYADSVSWKTEVTISPTAVELRPGSALQARV